MVILPDYYCGKMINPKVSPREELGEFIKNETQWEGHLQKVWEEKIKPYAVQHGAKMFGTIGNFLLENNQLFNKLITLGFLNKICFEQQFGKYILDFLFWLKRLIIQMIKFQDSRVKPFPLWQFPTTTQMTLLHSRYPIIQVDPIMFKI